MHHRKLTSFVLWAALAASARAQDAAQIEVRAAFPDATPAAGVELAIFRDPTESFALGDFTEVWRTGDDGRVCIDVLAYVAADLQRGRAHHLVAKVLGSRVTRVELDAQSLRGAPIALVVPAFGFVRAKVLAPDGHAIDRGHARIAWHAITDESRDRMGATACSEPIRKGELLTWPLELGGQIDLTFNLKQELEISRLRVPGPTRPGEVVALDFGARAATVLTATLVDETGRPLAREMVEAHWRYGRASTPELGHQFDGEALLTCDAAGRVRWCLPPDFCQEYRLGSLRLLCEPGRNPKHRPFRLATGLVARCDLPPAPVVGENDLGTLALARPPLFVAGRTIDRHGATLRDVGLRVEYLRPSGTWTTHHGLFALSDAAGRFEIRAFADEMGGTNRERSSSFRLIGRCSGFASSEPLQFPAGARDLDVVLDATGRVELQIASGDPDLWPSLRIGLLGFDDEHRVEGLQREGTSIYRWLNVPAGSYRLVICDEATGLPLFRCEPLHVRDGEILRDPRCSPVELDTFAQRVHLFVRNERGNFVERGHVRFPSLPGSGAGSINGGEAVLTLPRGTSVDALVLAEGFRPCLVEGWAADRAIALRPTLRRIFQVTGAPAHEVDEAAAIGFELQHAADSPLASLLRVPLALPGTPAVAPFEVELPGPGRYVLKTRGRNDSGPLYPNPPGSMPRPPVQAKPRHVPQEWTFDVTEEDQPPIVLAWRN